MGYNKINIYLKIKSRVDSIIVWKTGFKVRKIKFKMIIG